MYRTEQQMATILTELMSAWKKYPELRLGQLLANSIKQDLFYIEDEQLSKVLLEFINGH